MENEPRLGGLARCCREVGSVLRGSLAVLRVRWGGLILAVAAFLFFSAAAAVWYERLRPCPDPPSSQD